jgi:hypothetical protein
MPTMKAPARSIFTAAGYTGIAILTPLYLNERGVLRGAYLSHPGFYYGFAGCALAWQFAFLTIARNPEKYRALMPAAILEKAAFVASTVALWWAGRTPPAEVAIAMGLAALDGMWGVLFGWSYLSLKDDEEAEEGAAAAKAAGKKAL